MSKPFRKRGTSTFKTAPLCSTINWKPQLARTADMFTTTDKANQFHIPPPTLGREVMILFTLCSAQMMVQACFSQEFVPDNIIGRSFGASEADESWFPAAYALTSGMTVLLLAPPDASLT